MFEEDTVANLRTTVAEILENIKEVLAGQDVTLSLDGSKLPLKGVLEDFQDEAEDALAHAVGEAAGLAMGYVTSKFAAVMDRIGESVARFWMAVLHFPAVGENPFQGVSWSDPKDVKQL